MVDAMALPQRVPLSAYFSTAATFALSMNAGPVSVACATADACCRWSCTARGVDGQVALQVRLLVDGQLHRAVLDRARPVSLLVSKVTDLGRRAGVLDRLHGGQRERRAQRRRRSRSLLSCCSFEVIVGLRPGHVGTGDVDVLDVSANLSLTPWQRASRPTLPCSWMTQSSLLRAELLELVTGRLAGDPLVLTEVAERAGVPSRRRCRRSARPPGCRPRPPSSRSASSRRAWPASPRCRRPSSRSPSAPGWPGRRRPGRTGVLQLDVVLLRGRLGALAGRGPRRCRRAPSG